MTLLGLLAIGVSLRIAISDLYARRVPNAWLLTACAISIALIIAGQFSAPRLPWGSHVAGAVLGLVALLPFYAMRWMGAGDVKFFSVLGLMLGWQALLPVWIAQVWPRACMPCSFWCRGSSAPSFHWACRARSTAPARSGSRTRRCATCWPPARDGAAFP